MQNKETAICGGLYNFHRVSTHSQLFLIHFFILSLLVFNCISHLFFVCINRMSFLQQQLQSFSYNAAMDYYNEYAEEHWNSLDPYEDKEGNRRRLPNDISTKEEQKIWRNIQRKAWVHDKCFLGSCGVGMDCGLGLAPLVVLLFPVLGPLVMYAVHLNLIAEAERKVHLPSKLQAKLHGNIVLSLIITFPPVIGSFFGWLHGCSTRNAGLLYQYLEFLAQERAQNKTATYVGAARDLPNTPEFGRSAPPREMSSQQQRGPPPSTHPLEQRSYTLPVYQTRKAPTFSRQPKSRTTNTIVVGDQQLSGFV